MLTVVWNLCTFFNRTLESNDEENYRQSIEPFFLYQPYPYKNNKFLTFEKICGLQQKFVHDFV